MSEALILIDIQNDYFPGGRMEVPGAVAAAEAAARLLDGARRSGVPACFVKHLSSRPGAGFFLPGSEGAEIHPLIAPAPGEAVLVKHFPNSFRGTSLHEQLQQTKITRLFICGMMTQMCIDATVRAAFDLGYECVVAADACAARALSWNGLAIPAEQVQGAFLAALGAVYARIATVEQLLADGLSNPS